MTPITVKLSETLSMHSPTSLNDCPEKVNALRKAYFGWILNNTDAFAAQGCSMTAEQKTFELQLSLLKEVRAWGFKDSAIAICTNPQFDFENCGPSLTKFIKDYGSISAKRIILHPVVIVGEIVLDTCFLRLGTGVLARNNAAVEDYHKLWGCITVLNTVKCMDTVEELAQLIRNTILHEASTTDPNVVISSLSSAFSLSKRTRRFRASTTVQKVSI